MSDIIGDLEQQIRLLAKRVNHLFRQRAALVALLRSIRDNGGCTERHWHAIDRILASGKWSDPEDSGKH